MTLLKFSIDINAPKEKVWEQLWSDAGYRKWTSAFSEGSYAESDWQQGSSIKFLSPNGSGMYAIIEKSEPAVEMTFRHQGEVKNGVEQNTEWAGARESYYLQEENGVTTVNVEMDAGNEFLDYMQNTFPKALAILKQECEQ
jgi:uncharacterized protein YndB with AHSA1/START domain